MEKYSILILLFLLCNACSNRVYKPIPYTIKLNIVPYEEIQKSPLAKNNKWGYRTLRGWARMTISRKTGKVIACTIWTPPPNTPYDINTLLHELYHCQEGHFHWATTLRRPLGYHGYIWDMRRYAKKVWINIELYALKFTGTRHFRQKAAKKYRKSAKNTWHSLDNVVSLAL